MATAPVALLDEPDRLRQALSPIRRRLLERLREPASATGLAAELGLGRQNINYHLRALEHAGLVELAEERRRRGCVERVMVASARAFVVDPGLMGGRSRGAAAAQDRFAAESLVGVAGDVVRDVTRMRARAERQGKRLLTFSLDAEARLADPADLERFAAALARRLAETVAEFDAGDGGRRYRVVAGGYPGPRRRRGEGRAE